MDQGPSQSIIRSDAYASSHKALSTDKVTDSKAADSKTDIGLEVQVGQQIQLGDVASNREILLHGRRAFDCGDDEQALTSLRRLVAHGVRYADVHYMIGMIQERLGELEGALTELRESIRINPSYVEALLALASLHERRGEFDRSQGYAERASQLSRPSAAGLDPTTRGKLANQQALLADALVEADADAVAVARLVVAAAVTGFRAIGGAVAITGAESIGAGRRDDPVAIFTVAIGVEGDAFTIFVVDCVETEAAADIEAVEEAGFSILCESRLSEGARKNRGGQKCRFFH